MTTTVPLKVYESAVHGRQMFRVAYRRERDAARRMREALIAVRSKGICAGAAFVRGNDDRDERVLEVLDIIDSALAD